MPDIKTKNPNAVDQAIKQAHRLRLEYVHDDQPGIRREKKAGQFRYFYPDGKVVKSQAVLNRIRKLVIPPGYKDVWIAISPNAHIQATGIDKKGRKQYRYHAKWREHRDADKFYRMLQFAEALPKIRRAVRRDLKLRGLPKKKILATIVALLEKTLIRVGNEEYAEENNSFGLTTLHDKHVHVEGNSIRFTFKGKSGVYHDLEITEPNLAYVIKKAKDVPGFELFQYYDEKDLRHHVTSEDVNDYIRQSSGEYFTAKDFRTWHATILAAEHLAKLEKFENESQAKHNIIVAIDEVASHLGNTRSVCRKCYIHPAILEQYRRGSLKDNLARYSKKAPRQYKELSVGEKEVVQFLAAHA